ncbi:MAG: hypothetical protein PHQ43_12215 [Dehalococcoidales bacterium]|nr:hypothetical protein [Dehalococcoidales bacterium]
MNQQAPYPTTVPQSTQVEAQFLQGVAGFLMAALLAIWVVQQGIKVFRGEEIERPF